MAINIYGAFRSDTNLSDDAVTFASQGTQFTISAYSQITITDGADPTIIDGDNVVNEVPNDPTQTYQGRAIDWDYTIEVNDGVNTYEIGVMDWDINDDGDFDFPTDEQGYFLAFIGPIPPLNTTLTIGPVVDNGANIPVDTVVPCFTAGTQIKTPTGYRAVETLKAGDVVVTLDNGPQEIRWIGSRTLAPAELAAKPKLYPVTIAAGSLGRGLPNRDLKVSPQHRMLVRSEIAVRMFAAKEVLVPAHKLVDVPGVKIDDAKNGVTYFHMLFDRHEIVFAEGAPSESLYTGPEALKSLGTEARAEILELFPELRTPEYVPISARQIPAQGRRVRKMISRHVQNDRPLVGFL